VQAQLKKVGSWIDQQSDALARRLASLFVLGIDGALAATLTQGGLVCADGRDQICHTLRVLFEARRVALYAGFEKRVRQRGEPRQSEFPPVPSSAGKADSVPCLSMIRAADVALTSGSCTDLREMMLQVSQIIFHQKFQG
jgi:hypothetical protein